MDICDDVINRLLWHVLPGLLKTDLSVALADPGRPTRFADLAALLDVGRFDDEGALRHVAAIAALVDASPQTMGSAACPEGSSASDLERAAATCALLHDMVQAQVKAVRIRVIGHIDPCPTLRADAAPLTFWLETQKILRSRAKIKAEQDRLRTFQEEARASTKKLRL